MIYNALYQVFICKLFHPPKMRAFWFLHQSWILQRRTCSPSLVFATLWLHSVIPQIWVLFDLPSCITSSGRSPRFFHRKFSELSVSAQPRLHSFMLRKPWNSPLFLPTHPKWGHFGSFIKGEFTNFGLRFTTTPFSHALDLHVSAYGG